MSILNMSTNLLFNQNFANVFAKPVRYWKLSLRLIQARWTDSWVVAEGARNHNLSRLLFTERRNSLIHLVPSSYRSQGDSTVIHWQKILHTGESFEQNNSTIAIKGNGYYLIYTQVLYQDRTFVMGHVVKRREQRRQNEGETLLRCTQNMPADQPFNTCYSAGIYRLQKGDIIEMVIPRNSANIVMDRDSTFMGLMKV
ncbi:hypothetical protein scyTo_0013372 [Scyliorhinus torazame]|uniref:THD domain-containing protein n=1 Tax=Scyliorhinus torazame TaxID=75743 RepID=A0A401NUZ9_SCYTO|nr:hypothetical protein [Scyliorhinus torazame]